MADPIFAPGRLAAGRHLGLRADDPTHFYIRFAIYSVILTLWLPPIYSLYYDLVLPRMRGLTSSIYIIISTLLGLGMGPYFVGIVAIATAAISARRSSRSTSSRRRCVMCLFMRAAAHRQGREHGARARARGRRAGLRSERGGRPPKRLTLFKLRASN